MQKQQPLKIFIVYAREDAEALKELRVQFIPVARSERLEVWYDGDIGCKNCSADECGHTVMVNSFSIGKYVS
jgi:hypothetical protein